MVDKDIVLRKSEAIEHHASRLRAKLPLEAAAFALLARHRVIPEPLSFRLARAAGLRNLIVHRYTDILAPRLVEAIAAGLSDFDAFAGALRAHAGAAHQPKQDT